MKALREIPLAEADAEARLGQDVIDAKGRCLLAAGNRLTDSARAFLQKRGIASVIIECEQTLTAEQLDAQRTRVTQAIASRFRAIGDDAGLACLRDVLLDYRLRSLA